MDKIVIKKIDESEYRYALMGYDYEPYRVVSITRMNDKGNYRLILELRDEKQE